jgi:hypothetical protein
MPRALKPKTLACITPAREGSTYQLELEDEAGKRVLFALTSYQALLAEQLDDLLADDQEELHPRPAVPQVLTERGQSQLPVNGRAAGSVGTVWELDGQGAPAHASTYSG